MTLPFAPAPLAELRSLRDSLAAWRPDAVEAASSPPFVDFYSGARAAVRTYAVALLDLARGDSTAAEAAATRLEAVAAPPVAVTFAQMLAAGLRAQRVAGVGHRQEALRILAAAPANLPRDYTPVHFAIQSPERWLRAELLRELGRDEEALGWYGTLEELATGDLIYLAPVHLRRGEIAERRGRRAEAAAHYARVVELYRRADPELQPLRLQAQRALARLGNE